MLSGKNQWGIQSDPTWYLGTLWNLYLEPLLETFEPSLGTCGNPYLEPRNLPKPSLGTCTWNLGTSWNLYAEPFFELWNLLKPYLHLDFWNLHLELLLGTLEPLENFTCNFGTSRILYLEPFLETWEPLEKLTWNPEPLLGTSEPSVTFTCNP